MRYLQSASCGKMVGMTKISFNQLAKKTSRGNGYGYARQMCEESLTRLGYEVVFADPSADVEINFCSPGDAIWSGVDYRIIYVPWESTEFPDGWIGALNEVDEVWTPSRIVSEWMINAGVQTPISIYEHGVEALWRPRRRLVGSGQTRFLHTGTESIRKGGDLVVSSFYELFSDKSAHLTLKMMIDNFSLIDNEQLSVLRTEMPIERLVDLYHSCHALIYPSWGEGFGLTPLQALATGMPVLITKGWAPYEDLVPERFLINSSLVESPWQGVHPGKMFKPDVDDLKDKWMDLFNNYSSYSKQAFNLSSTISARYDWDSLTKEAFKNF